MQVSVSETPRRLSFRHFSFFIFILSRIFHTDVADETQKWKKKKKRKREGCFPLFLAANNLCTFLDYAESRWCLLPFKEVGAKGHSFLKVPPKEPTLFTPPYVQIKLVIRFVALIRPLLWALWLICIFVLPVSTSCFPILWIILRRRRRRRRKRISSLRLAFRSGPK